MNIRISLFALLLSLVFNVAVKAQQDTSVYELGRVNLPKKFTQSVTIKATELEKIPFTNLSDVVTTWLYGYYGDKKSYVYVVDGILNSDVNAYSVFDIEEITMVQNASIYLNGALPGQVLLVVKTKRHVGRASGVDFNGQTNIINLRNTYSANNTSSTKNFYHQYYVSAYKNTSNINAGASVTFQHNAFPVSKDYTSAGKVYNADRFKFNGYLNAKLGAANQLSITGGYVPQNDVIDITNLSFVSQGSVLTATKGNATQSLLYANVGLVSKIAEGFTNKFRVGYITRKTNIDLSKDQTTNFPFSSGNNGTTTLSDSDSSGRANSFLVNDDLSYILRIGKISLTPNINITYKRITENTAYSNNLTTQQPVANYKFSRDLASKTSMFLLTPSITLNYNEILVLQGGFQKPLNNDRYSAYQIKQTDMMPFANVGLDILKAAGSANKDMTLLFSGSYARSLAISGEPFISLSDQIMSFASTTTQYPYSPDVNVNRTLNQLQAGLSFSMFQNRLSVSYNYQVIKTFNYITLPLFSPPYNYYLNYQFDRQINVNRFAVNADVLNKGTFKWRSALNISIFKNDRSSANPTVNTYLPALTKNDFVTGGMVNRFNYRQLSAGLDILYCFNQERYGGSLSSIPGNNYYSINLQNIYAGYSFKALGIKNIEVYANSRNMLMTNNSTITDNRRFYGLGFKTEL